MYTKFKTETRVISQNTVTDMLRQNWLSNNNKKTFELIELYQLNLSFLIVTCTCKLLVMAGM